MGINGGLSMNNKYGKLIVIGCLIGLLIANCFISDSTMSKMVGGICAALGLLYIIISEIVSKKQ